MPRLKIPEEAGAKCMLHIFCAREPQRALMGAICWPGIFPRGISGGLFDAFRGHPKRRDPLRILRFCDAHFQIFGAARHDFIKKKDAALGRTRGSRHSQVTIFAATFAFSSGPKRVTFFLKGKKRDLKNACLGE